MNRITSKNIRQILIPAMEEHGFTHAFYPDCCVFVKRNEEGGENWKELQLHNLNIINV